MINVEVVSQHNWLPSHLSFIHFCLRLTLISILEVTLKNNTFVIKVLVWAYSLGDWSHIWRVIATSSLSSGLGIHVCFDFYVSMHSNPNWRFPLEVTRKRVCMLILKAFHKNLLPFTEEIIANWVPPSQLWCFDFDCEMTNTFYRNDKFHILFCSCHEPRDN
mgnify:CR=1 FL=1